MADTENTNPAPEPEDTKPAAEQEGQEPAEDLVAKLREQNEALAKERDTAKESLDRLRAEREGGDNDVAKRLADAEKRVKDAEDRIAAAERATALERVYREFPKLDDDEFRDLLTGSTEEELMASANRLIKLAAALNGSTDEGERTRPEPKLRPAQGADDADDDFDPVAIAKAIRR